MALARRDFNRFAMLGAGLVLSGGLRAAPGDIASLYDSADAMALAQLVRSGQVHPKELLDEALRRAEAVNPRINAISLKHYELAADSIERGLPSGPFTGVPFLLKDLGVRLEGTVTTYGSRLHAQDLARSTSLLAQRYQEAGLVIFGKTITPEYGLALTTENLFQGDCLNPWNTVHSTGGSSGGAAAAVAAGIVPAVHATDGGGSIRVPANHCGAFGFKPTRGMTPGANGAAMSIGHAISRSVRDSAALLDVSAGYEAGAPFGLLPDQGGFLVASQRDPGPLKVALNLDSPEVEIHPDCRRAVMDTAKLLERLGHRVEEAAPSLDYVRMNDVQNILMAVKVAAGLRRIEQGRGRAIAPPEIEPMTDMIRRSASEMSQYDYASALTGMHAIGRTMGGFLEDYDLILQPVTATPAPPIGAINYREGDDLATYTGRFKKVSAFTHLYNLSGQPSMSLPLAMSTDGLPIGVMLSGRVGEDARLFSLAGQIERAAPWTSRRPPIHAGSEG
jgi:Asp-tRNA(Asn)/Glu-tRNA(Gln) amidotransferase A subunit family amidase